MEIYLYLLSLCKPRRKGEAKVLRKPRKKDEAKVLRKPHNFYRQD